MCGIAGILRLDGTPASAEAIQDMTAALAHRGPDGKGHLADGCIALGHRRLAIIDLSEAAAQPMTTEDGRFTLVYNGEVYNFGDLRRELEMSGHRFRSRSDTEVVLRAYAEWGGGCVKRFNGMFAFAVWDASRKELFLARDRYGIKPIYYTFQDGLFLFASEQKAILAHPGVPRVMDLAALYEYFTFQNIFTDRTFFKGIRIFPAGCQARVSGDRGSDGLGAVRYWDFDFREPDAPGTDEEYVEELDRLFNQAVRRQLVSDVGVGAYLSGGTDSGSITAVAAAALPYIKTFTCGFDLRSASGLELAFDEREKAEYMSYLFKTEHYEMVLKSGDMERVLPALAWHLEEPRVGQSYPNFYAAKLASRFTKVVLSGVGGDELFGGYPWRYYRASSAENFDRHSDLHYEFWQRLLPNASLKEVFRPVWSEVRDVWTRDIFRSVFRERPGRMERVEDSINQSLAFEARTFLHGLLVVEDKLSMAHGLETRVPFLDNDLVDFALQVPVRLKVRASIDVLRIDENALGDKGSLYTRRTRDGKVLLRKMMERYVPSEITSSEKQGFSAPDASWFRGESIDYVRRTLFDGNARIYDYLDSGAVRKLVNDHLNGTANRRLFIWSLLNFEQWCRVFLP